VELEPGINDLQAHLGRHDGAVAGFEDLPDAGRLYRPGTVPNQDFVQMVQAARGEVPDNDHRGAKRGRQGGYRGVVCLHTEN
jgi:hypothetical protein